MAGYLISDKDFYKGEYHLFNLKKAVANAGGTKEHLKLFDFLLTPSITPKKERRMFHDQRAASSMLFVFPPKVQILLSILFYNEELIIKSIVSELEEQFTIRIPNPEEIVNLSRSISLLPVGNTFMRVLSESKYTRIPNKNLEDTLKFVLCMKTEKEIYSKKDIVVRDKIDRVVDVLNFTNLYIDSLKEIAVKNDRMGAAVLIAQALNYSTRSIQTIAGIAEIWQLENSQR